MEPFQATINGKTIDLSVPINKAEARAMRGEVSRRVKRKVQDDWELCGWLYHTKNVEVKDGKETMAFYEYCEYEDWESYVEDEIGLVVSMAKRYVRVWTRFAVELGSVLDTSLIVNITKMIRLSHPNSGMTEKNVNKWLKRAATMDDDEIASIIDPRRSTTQVTFHYHPTQDTHHRKAFRMLAEEFGDEITKGNLFINLCKEYVQNRNKKRKKQGNS